MAHPYWSGLPPEVGLPGCRRADRLGAVQRELRTRERARGFLLYLGPGARGPPVALRDRHRRQSLPAVRHRRRLDHGGGQIAHAMPCWICCSPVARTPRTGPCCTRCAATATLDEVRCSPCVSVCLQTRYQEGWAVRADHRGRQEGAHILRAERRWFGDHTPSSDLLEDLPFVRVVATDAEGRRAWTNPL